MLETLQVLHNKVMMKRASGSRYYDKGGLLLRPERAQEKQHFGTVVSVGREVESVKKGDRILVGKYTGLELEDEEHVILEEEQILAVLEEG